MLFRYDYRWNLSRYAVHLFYAEASASKWNFGSFKMKALNNGSLMNVSQANPCSANPVNAFSLDYSQPLYNGGTQTSQQHILQRHTTGLPGTSQYFGNFSQIKNINVLTYLFGSQNLQGNSVLFQYTVPQLLYPFATTHIGTDPSGQHTSTNRLITQANCQTVVTSYPITDPGP